MLAAVERHREAKTFIVATEHGIVYQLKKRFPDKEFIVADGCIGCRMHCPYMKMVDLVMVRDALRRGKHEIEVPADVAGGRPPRAGADDRGAARRLEPMPERSLPE